MFISEALPRPQLVICAQAPVPTRVGLFDMLVFRYGDAAHAETGLSPDHVALVMGDVRGKRGVTVRVHSECLTSEVFGSLKCDCREQLEAAQEEVARRGLGVVIYLRQEGRGIGLSSKIRAYELQSRGHDTVDANRLLGLPDDARDYQPAAAILEHLGVSSIKLMTNNPEKVDALSKLGVEITARLPAIIRPNPFSASYLDAKRRRMGHALPPTHFEEGSSLGESVADAE
ncbi:GTP cyclohydrolase II [Chondromyces crocatus]|uniref:GTP cyclohydrolase-2 n=1 Tax=Chondromyces crocatus TaxID=52 RepID=A0A0K1EEG0_CHOCO|nr:GTP cyclohydrolase II [Chondromyces crocatus]AKT39256.1 riboflavin biosynthesis protein RibA [Chondromyces crocatus]